MTIRNTIKKLIHKDAKVEYPREANHGDYSTNFALVEKIDVKKLAAKLQKNSMFEKVETAGPGFINFYLAPAFLQKQLDKTKLPNIGKNKKIQVEFISANPTGSLTMGNGRGGFVGDCLANILSATGFAAQREYYINDRGKQIEDLKKGKYKGEKRTAAEIQKQNQKAITEKLKIKFDKWFSEKSLYDSGQVDKILKLLEKKSLTYKKEGALWLKTTKFGDDKDRVLIKKQGEKTYLLSDIAYFQNKMKRGFKKVINIWGADHHGYIGRFKAMIKALGYKEDVWQILIMQLVRLAKDGKEFKMSKRAGNFVTLEWLVDEVGLDAARFFFLMHDANRHMNFDLNLAKEKSQNNPVYYVQYAHARICSIIRKLKAENEKLKTTAENLKHLKHTSELSLIKQLVKFPETVEDIAKDYQTQRLPQYAMELARTFHKFYQDCQVISDDKDLTQARLALLLETKNILKQTLDLMGISAPEKM